MPPTKVDHSNTICCLCGTDKTCGHWRRCYDKKGKWNRKYVCNKCYKKNWNRETFLSDRRTGNINPNCSSAKGDLFEELTCVWRGVKSLNKENDNYCSPIDHSRDPELGIIQTQGKFYNSYNQIWEFGNVWRDHNKDFSVMICYCTNKNGTIIERIYIFPKKELINRHSITITKFPLRNSDTLYWYEKYRVTDEEEIKKVNKIWKKIKSMK